MRLRRAPSSLIATVMLSTVLLATGLTACAAAAQPGAATSAARPAAAAATGTARASVPWNRVGPGWILAQYTSARPGGSSAPLELYLISPGGTKYQLARWPNSQTAPYLVAWSPDGQQALFHASAGRNVELLTLATGRVSTFALPGGVSPIGFTMPRGLAIVALRPGGSGYNLAQYTLSGAFARQLGDSSDGAVLYTPSGLEFVTGARDGLKLVGNLGPLIRQLPVPHSSVNSCAPVRWWNSDTVLAECEPPGSAIARLWLVPVSGAWPAALTPLRTGPPDLGDLDAWQLSSGLYLQSAGPCGVLQIFKQAANGSISLVSVPNTMGDNHVLSALGSRLLIQAPTGCIGSNSLLWFNPANRAEQWLIRAPASAIGITTAVPFYSRENGNR
jgi:hypothetical protein